MNARPIHIVGGGVGGLALGIRLRQLGIETRISEAGHYPRHRVCGEFISGRGIELIKELGLFESFAASGGKMANTMKFFGARNMSPLLQMPQAAFCISRFAMDQIMSFKFESMGGQLSTGRRVALNNKPEEGTVLATGRRPKMDKLGSWTGYKFHLRGMKLDADLEMHYNDYGYLGMCAVENDCVNVCGLIKSKMARGLAWRSNWQGFLRSNLHSKKHGALKETDIVTDSICCVSGVSYSAFQLRENDAFPTVGDHMSTIPPLTGNGMSLAIESALLVAESIENYSHDQASWNEMIEQICLSQSRVFQKRLRVSVPLQQFLMSQYMHGIREYLIKHISFFHRILFNLTR
jgi:2-polyprenyl-6-methoxyphenol hydroxylase-like FAD-dependent oxidoreductase